MPDVPIHERSTVAQLGAYASGRIHQAGNGPGRFVGTDAQVTTAGMNVRYRESGISDHYALAQLSPHIILVLALSSHVQSVTSVPSASE